MSTVETVRGAVAAAELGRTLPHEHVLILQPEALQNYGHVWGESYWDEDDRVRDAIEKLRAVREAGFRTLVDPTAPGLGRCIPRIQRINAEVDLNIVVASGVYAFLELPNFLHYRSAEAIAELFVREIREGIDDTGVQGGVPQVRRRGARRRRRHPAGSSTRSRSPRTRRARRSWCTRTPAPRRGRWRSRSSRDAVSTPTRIVVAHAGDSNDLDYLRAIGDTGAVLGFDRFNIPHFNPDEDRIRDAARPARGGLRRPHPPLARRRVLHGLHGRRPELRRRAARLPPPLARRSSRCSASAASPTRSSTS